MILKKHFQNGLILLVCSFVFLACEQDKKTAESAEIKEEKAATETTLPVKKVFHKIPTDKVDIRVYICENNSVPDFHLKYDCPTLPDCTGNFRNMTILRAVEDFNRSFCPVCSKSVQDYFSDGVQEMKH